MKKTIIITLIVAGTIFLWETWSPIIEIISGTPKVTVINLTGLFGPARRPRAEHHEERTFSEWRRKEKASNHCVVSGLQADTPLYPSVRLRRT